MPRWSSSVIPEGALARQRESEHLKARRYPSPTSGIAGIGEGAPIQTNFQAFMKQQQQHEHSHHRNHHQAQQRHHFLNNPQYSEDKVTVNMPSRALAANGTFGANTGIVIPCHIRSVVSTLRRNVEEMKKFAAEIPILTSAETPSAIKRLAALLFAQTIAVEDLVRFTSDELRFASGQFYNLVADLEETNRVASAACLPFLTLNAVTAARKAVVEISSSTSNNLHTSDANACSSSSNNNNASSSTAIPTNLDDTQRHRNANDDGSDEELYFADSNRAAETLRELDAARRKILMSARSRKSSSPQGLQRSQQQQQQQLQYEEDDYDYNDPHAASPMSEALRETNSFRSLYTMLAGIANITGAAEARLFLFPSTDMLAQDSFAEAMAHSVDLTRTFADLARYQQQSSSSGAGGDAGPSSAAGIGLPLLDSKRLYLVAQVQSSPFCPTKTATAPRDIVRVAESVAMTRCSANLTPGVQRVRASFSSLVAVPLFMSRQPESAVLGVLVLTNKRSTTSNSGASSSSTTAGKKSDGGDGHHPESFDDDSGGDTENSKSSSKSGGGYFNFDKATNAAGGTAWVTRGFFTDDEHKAVVAAEMMAWLVEAVPLGVILRGSVRLSPAGFAEEWNRWACGAGNAAAAAAMTRASSSNGDKSSFHQQQHRQIPVLDPEMASMQVPRRRFVFRTEDPREVAASGALKLHGGSGAASSSSSGSKNLSKTRAVIAPETGEYLLNVAQSHRKLEMKTALLGTKVESMRLRMEQLESELAAETQLRRHAEGAAHSMQVACDRVIRKCVLGGGGFTTTPSSTTSPVNTNSNNKSVTSSHLNQQQQQQQQTTASGSSRPASSGSPLKNAAGQPGGVAAGTNSSASGKGSQPANQQQYHQHRASLTHDAALADLLHAYTEVSAPFSQTTVGVAKQHPANPSTSRPSSRPSSRGSSAAVAEQMLTSASLTGRPPSAPLLKTPLSSSLLAVVPPIPPLFHHQQQQQQPSPLLSHQHLLSAAATFLAPTNTSVSGGRNAPTYHPPQQQQLSPRLPSAARKNMSRRF